MYKRQVWTPDNVIGVIGEFADAISYQPDDKYFNLTEMARVHRVSGGRPMLIADMGFAFPHEGYGKQEWSYYESQEAAGEGRSNPQRLSTRIASDWAASCCVTARRGLQGLCGGERQERLHRRDE